MTGIYKLYGSPISLYTAKVRAYLRYKNIPFIEEPGDKKIFERIGFRMIPVLHTPDNQLIQDTTDIIDYLEKQYPNKSVYPEGPQQKFVALLLEVYGDEWLRIAALHYRWAYNRDYILEEFGKKAVPEGTREERIAVGMKLSEHFRGSVPMLGITEDTMPAIEQWYEELLGQLNEHFTHHWYLFGSRPSIGDFGLMGPLYAHNYRDPASGDIMRRLAPRVCRWIDIMNTPDPLSGRFLEGDEVPATLLPVLKRVFADCVPAMIDTVRVTEKWIEANPDADEIPRRLDDQKFHIGDIEGTRKVLPFSQWMFQRPLNFYQSLTGDDKSSVDRLLVEVGGFAAMQIKIKYALSRRNYKLVHNK